VDEPRPLSYRDAAPERGLLRDAMIELVAGGGIEALKAAAIAERAGLSRAEFDRHFAGVDDCCAQVYQEDIDEFDRLVFGAYERHQRWLEGIRAAAYAAARFFRDRPLATGFDLVEMFSIGELAQAQRDKYMQRVIDLVDRGRSELADPDSVSRAVAESAVGSVVELLYKEVRANGDAAAADDFVPGLMYVVVRPYVGEQAARAELSIPPPPEPEKGRG
jgi:AcrR family transcriptional regulator